MSTPTFATLRHTTARLAIAALLIPGARASAQHCVTPGTTPSLAVRVAAGTEWGGEGSASGGTIALHGRRWFVGGEYTDRGYALGRRQFQPAFSVMESQHQVLGLRAGSVNPLGRHAAFCISGGYGIGTGMRVEYFGDPELGGAGFESHKRVRGDVEFVRELRIGAVRLLPSASVGILMSRETQFIGDIIEQGLQAYVPITFTVGVPVNDAFSLRARLNTPPGQSRGSSFGVDGVVHLP